jgi:hypothetical protein
MGLVSRIKTWASLEKLYAADLNAEFNNVVNSFTPNKIEGASGTLGNMQANSSPGSVGGENPAGDLLGELRQIRYMLKALSGEAYWYSPPTKSMVTLGTNVNNIPINVSWNITGNLHSSTSAAVDNGVVIPANMTITGLAISVMIKDTNYTGPGVPILSPNIYAGAPGVAGTTIFSTPPSMTCNTANYDYMYYNFATSTLVTAPANPATVVNPILTSATLAAGTRLYMSFAYGAAGSDAQNMQVQLFMRPT